MAAVAVSPSTVSVRAGEPADWAESVKLPAGEQPTKLFNGRDLDGWEGPWNFSSPERATASLERAGFADVRCWLETRVVNPPDPREFLRVVCLGHHLERLPEDLRDPFVDAVLARAGKPVELDYVRLNISAAKPQFS